MAKRDRTMTDIAVVMTLFIFSSGEWLKQRRRTLSRATGMMVNESGLECRSDVSVRKDLP